MRESSVSGKAHLIHFFALETQEGHLKGVHFFGLIYPHYLLPYIYLGRNAITLTLVSVWSSGHKELAEYSYFEMMLEVRSLSQYSYNNSHCHKYFMICWPLLIFYVGLLNKSWCVQLYLLGFYPDPWVFDVVWCLGRRFSVKVSML